VVLWVFALCGAMGDYQRFAGLCPTAQQTVDSNCTSMNTTNQNVMGLEIT